MSLTESSWPKVIKISGEILEHPGSKFLKHPRLKFLKENDLEIHEFRGIRTKFSTLKTNQKTRVIKINFISENHAFLPASLPPFTTVLPLLPHFPVVYDRRENGTVVMCDPL